MENTKGYRHWKNYQGPEFEQAPIKQHEGRVIPQERMTDKEAIALARQDDLDRQERHWDEGAYHRIFDNRRIKK